MTLSLAASAVTPPAVAFGEGRRPESATRVTHAGLRRTARASCSR